MKDNTRTTIGYVCIALVIISYILFLAWVSSPNEFTFKIEMDNNTKEAIDSIDYNSINNEIIWSCPMLLEKGTYTFIDGSLISPSGIIIICEDNNALHRKYASEDKS